MPLNLTNTKDGYYNELYLLNASGTVWEKVRDLIASGSGGSGGGGSGGGGIVTSVLTPLNINAGVLSINLTGYIPTTHEANKLNISNVSHDYDFRTHTLTIRDSTTGNTLVLTVSTPGILSVNGDAMATQNYVTNLLTSYLTTAAASSTYLSQSLAASTYLSQTNAASTYATIATVNGKQDSITAGTGLSFSGSTLNTYQLKYNTTQVPGSTPQCLIFNDFTVSNNLNVGSGQYEFIVTAPVTATDLAGKQDTLSVTGALSLTGGNTLSILPVYLSNTHEASKIGAANIVHGFDFETQTLTLKNSGGTTGVLSVDSSGDLVLNTLKIATQSYAAGFHYNHLTTTVAAATYLTIANAASTYLLATTAASTYATISSLAGKQDTITFGTGLTLTGGTLDLTLGAGMYKDTTANSLYSYDFRINGSGSSSTAVTPASPPQHIVFMNDFACSEVMNVSISPAFARQELRIAADYTKIQSKLTAGSGIVISGSTISSTGGLTGVTQGGNYMYGPAQPNSSNFPFGQSTWTDEGNGVSSTTLTSNPTGNDFYTSGTTLGIAQLLPGNTYYIEMEVKLGTASNFCMWLYNSPNNGLTWDGTTTPAINSTTFTKVTITHTTPVAKTGDYMLGGHFLSSSVATSAYNYVATAPAQQSPGTVFLRNFGIRLGNNALTTFTGDLKATGVMTAQSYVTSSDSLLKTNVAPLSVDECFQMLTNVEAKTYNRIDIPGNKRVGFIANDIKANLPTDCNNILGNAVYQSQGILTMDYSRLTPILWTLTKSQQATIEELSKRVEALEAKNT